MQEEEEEEITMMGSDKVPPQQEPYYVDDKSPFNGGHALRPGRRCRVGRVRVEQCSAVAAQSM